MPDRYRYTFKSEEKAGASTPNIIEVMDPSNVADFGAALSGVISGDLLSVSKELRRNYTRPYPAGTFKVMKVIMRDATGAASVQWLFNVDDGPGLKAYLEGNPAGLALPNTGNRAVSVVTEETNVENIPVT